MTVQTIPYPPAASGIQLAPPAQRWTPLHDVRALIWLIDKTDGAIVEIGCNEGYTTRDIALAYPHRTVHGIDYTGPGLHLAVEQAGEQPRAGRLGIQARALPNVRIHEMRSADIDYSAMDDPGFIFIDGDHSYTGVKLDSLKALRHIEARGRGIIAWHDYYQGCPDWVGVRDFLHAELAHAGGLRHIAGTWLAFWQG